MAAILGKIKRAKKPKAYQFFSINYPESDDNPDSGTSNKIILTYFNSDKSLTFMGKFKESNSDEFETSGSKK
jgi:hypothetical protein